MVEQANKHQRPSQFAVGDLVSVKSKEFIPEEGISQKLLPAYRGPWQVLDVKGEADGPSYTSLAGSPQALVPFVLADVLRCRLGSCPSTVARARMCDDYRGLNKIMRKSTKPLPRIDDLVDMVQGCTLFSKIDLKSGYHQIEMAEGDVHKTTFRTRYGTYEYLVMPFGLCNARGTFQTEMHHILRSYLAKFVVVYLDDILVFSWTAQEHAKHLALVLQALHDNKYKINREKSSFGVTFVTYLGHVIFGERLAPEVTKVAAVQDWTQPVNVRDMTEGHQWLLDNLHVVPKENWGTDPFGVSSTMAYLLEQMGFEHMVVQRVHYEVKKALAQRRSLEFLWQQHWAEVTRQPISMILCHVMPFYSYDVPHTCGPDPSVCCQFDFWHLPEFSDGAPCPWSPQPELIEDANVEERAFTLLDQYRKKSLLYRTNTLLVMLGDDFRYLDKEETDLQFMNYEALFKYMNNRSAWNVHASWGTIGEYFRALEAEAGRSLHRKSGDRGGRPPALPSELGSRRKRLRELFPTIEGDFFTYADKDNEYWSGYYTSRPFYKALVRVMEETVRAAEILFTFVRGGGPTAATPGDSSGQYGDFLYGFYSALVSARRAVALFQHHDAITGTSRVMVVSDYGKRLHATSSKLKQSMARAVELLLVRVRSRGSSLGVSDRANGHEGRPMQSNAYATHRNSDRVSHTLRAELTQKESTSLLSKELIDVQKDAMYRVAIFNPLEGSVSRVVTLIVSTAGACILDKDGKPMRTQAMPEWVLGGSRGETSGHQRISWLADVPAMGIATYYVMAWSYGVCSPPQRARIEVVHPPAGFSCPIGYRCETLTPRAGDRDEDVVISNADMRVKFAPKTGMIRSMQSVGDDREAQVSEALLVMKSSGGAYLIRPVGHAQRILREGGAMFVLRGSLSEEVYTQPSTSLRHDNVLSRSARLYKSGSAAVQAAVVEVEYYLNMKPWSGFLRENKTNSTSSYDGGEDDYESERSRTGTEGLRNAEFLLRYQTNLRSGRKFYTDANGFQAVERRYMTKIALQGNYYPMTAYMFLEGDDGTRFTVHSRHAVAASSPVRGSLEMVVDRRMENDDEKGLRQGLNDNLPLLLTFHLLVEKSAVEKNGTSLGNRTSTLWGQPSFLSHQVSKHLNHPFHVFIGEEDVDMFSRHGMSKTGLRGDQISPGVFSPLIHDFPPGIHVVSLRAMGIKGFEPSTSESTVGGPSAVVRSQSATVRGQSAVKSQSTVPSGRSEVLPRSMEQVRSMPQGLQTNRSTEQVRSTPQGGLETNRSTERVRSMPQGLQTNRSTEQVRFMSQVLQTNHQMAIILQRYGCDCRYLWSSTVKETPADEVNRIPNPHDRSVPGSYARGPITLEQMFDGFELVGLQETSLTLSDRNAPTEQKNSSSVPGHSVRPGSSRVADHGGYNSQGGTQHASRLEEQEDRSRSHEGSVVKLEPMQLRAYTFELKRRLSL
ncbi:hypothetical protein CBR_g22451 [Chara braunii]|uniref:Reverse transcriptase domain-containing protein n=1 Tax=Chara braunii TaxID=69332 RepID=A0A388L2M9_CHABU|nr:hypothetical protein CBR_g22451 [Chara braunii]|eukprot:GBG76570.1 hypothetical protein CBR_g22451 [Chara braunii]